MNYALKERIEEIKKKLPSEDILVFEFDAFSGKKFACIYADGIVDKNMIGELVIKPLRAADKDASAEEIKKLLASPDVKDGKNKADAVKNISDGNAVLFIDGEKSFYIIGVKNPPGRSVAEPPTQVTVKGPREGFTEDIKVNLGLVRKRVKSDKFQVKTISVGNESQTAVAICYLDGICPKGLPEKIEKQILANEIDIIPDSSYVAGFISERPKSLFKRNATCEKPDIFCAKMCEGRVGIIVDGSPIALTVPYMLVEDFQAAEDYYAVSYRSTILRILRLTAVILGILMPAIYVCAQLFK
ncbi:MAG: spore germination protein, partial [Clostridia bacterium]|nr:spore germination protein [Clostridia bacterium]